MPFAISRTKSFRQLQGRIGQSTYHFNSILIGLECIASGAGHTGSIAVTWKKPGTLSLARQTADQAKTLACSSVLVLGSDVFDSFLRNIASENWLGFSEETKKIATKAVTKKGGGAYSARERTAEICAELQIDDDLSLAAIDLFVIWRNQVAHDDERECRLRVETRDYLLGVAADIYTKYAHLDIDLALKNFSKKNPPVAKEVTTLLAIATNLSRRIDSEAIKRAAGSVDGLIASVENLLKEYFASEARESARKLAEINDAFQGPEERRAKVLRKILANVGVTETTKPVSVFLPDAYFIGLLQMDRKSFVAKFAEHLTT